MLATRQRPTPAGGLAVANSQIYFTTHDGTLYAYGIPLER